MNASPEHRLLLACTRQHFQDAHIDFVTDLCRQYPINWLEVYFTARNHGVAPLIYYNLQKFPPADLGAPAEIFDLFKQALLQNVLLKERLHYHAQKATKFFKANNLEVMLVKGVALDILVYEQPWFTAMGDIDLVVNKKRHHVSDETFNAFMTALHGTSIEYDYYTHHDVTMNGILPVDFDRIWQDAEPAMLGDEEVLVMNPEDFLISVCINSCRKRYFRLKTLCDIAEIVNKYPQLKWDNLVAKSRDYDCEHIVFAALLATKTSVGCETPPEVFDALLRRSVRKPLLRWLVERSSLSAYEALRGSIRIRGRVVDGSLFLPYATLRWHQIWKKARFALQTSYAGEGMP